MSPRLPRSRSREGTVTDLVKELLPRIVTEAKDGTGLVFAVTNGDTADLKAGHLNTVPVGGAGAGLPPHQTGRISRSLTPACRG